MPDTAIVIGLMLAILGVWGYFGAPAEHRSLTAFIPTAVGLVLAALGVVGRKEGLRKHAMHAAAAVGLLGCLFAAGWYIVRSFVLDKSLVDAAGLSTLTMAALCGVFVVLCVRSFNEARRRRRQEEAGAASPRVP